MCTGQLAWDMHAQAIRRYYARADDGNFLLRSHSGFWHAAENVVIARVQIDARICGDALTDHQIRTAAYM